MLNLNQVDLSYGNKKILDNLSLELNQSEIVGLVAPNGTGKTTLLRSIAGLLKPEKGQIEINGQSVQKNRINYYEKFYFAEGTASLYGHLSGNDHLSYVKNAWHSTVDISEIIEKLKIADYVDLPVKKLSLGMKQHILLAMCFVSDANVILLDEPMNGLDPTSMRRISLYLKKLKEEEKLILLSSHILTNIDTLASRVLFLKNGKIAHNLDMNKEKFSSESTYNKLYDVEEEFL